MPLVTWLKFLGVVAIIVYGGTFPLATGLAWIAGATITWQDTFKVLGIITVCYLTVATLSIVFLYITEKS